MAGMGPSLGSFASNDQEVACLELCAGGAGHLVGDLAQVDASHEVHLARVDAQDVGTR